MLDRYILQNFAREIKPEIFCRLRPWRFVLFAGAALAQKKWGQRPHRLTVSVSIRLDAKPHAVPLDHDAIHHGVQYCSAPKFQVGWRDSLIAHPDPIQGVTLCLSQYHRSPP